MNHVETTLRTLGIPRTYNGFDQAAYAIELILDDARCLHAVTKEIYRQTAQHFGCDWRSVERNIRTAVQRAWRVNAAYLISIAGYPLPQPPTASEFIEIVSNHVQRSREAAPAFTPGL